MKSKMQWVQSFKKEMEQVNLEIQSAEHGHDLNRWEQKWVSYLAHAAFRSGTVTVHGEIL